jgi:phosphoglycolate phosphatase-like HAD superfamily hydrolase
VAPFVALGVDRSRITFGHVLADECARLGISLDAYIQAYDHTAARPFPGVEELLARLDRWAVCSNKVRISGRAELARLGWTPEVALFAEDFGRRPKELGPVLDALGVPGPSVVFVGDTAHDRRCAGAVGATFALAGWNPRTEPQPGDIMLAEPAALLAVLDGTSEGPSG